MAKQRNVDYVLRVVTDPNNAKTAASFAQHFKDLEASARGAERAAKAASAAVRSGGGSGGRGGRGGAAGAGSGFAAGYDRAAIQDFKRAAAEERRERELNIRQAQDIANRERRILAERVRANVEASRRIRDAAREANAASWRNRQAANAPATPQAVDFRGHVQQLGRYAAADEAAERRAERARMAGLKDIRGAFKDTTQAVGLYARALVLANVADEESAQRMISLIARFQAYADIVVGTAKAFEALAKARKAYAAIEAAGGLAGGGGRGVLLGGGAAAGAGGIGAAVGGAAATGGLIAAGASIVAGTLYLAKVGAEMVRNGRTFQAATREANGMFIDGFKELVGLGDMAKESADAWKKRWSNVAATIEARGREANAARDRQGVVRGINREILGLIGGIGLSGTAADIGGARAQLIASARNFGDDRDALARFDNRGNVGPGGLQQRGALLSSAAESGRQYIDDMKEVLRLTIQEKQEKIDGERQALAGLRSRKAEAEALLRREKEAKQSAAERFGAMSAAERAQVTAAAQRIQAGQGTQKDEEKLAQLGDFNSIKQRRIDRANANGFEQALGFLVNPGIFKAQAQVNNLAAKIDVKHEMIVKWEGDIKKISEEMTKKITELLRNIEPQLLAALDNKLRQENEQRALREAGN
ncbi:MAG: hypothetical protein JNL96_00200 [Planctomycetaceae bacterium]|nr:hypothetical protein [Planctomycetaceae bacterium]